MVNVQSKLLLSSLCVSMLLLTGCQKTIQTPVHTTTPPITTDAESTVQSIDTTSPHSQASQSEINQVWDIQGKIGFKSSKQSGSAFYTWQQNDREFDIQLNGILGIGKTIIRGDGTQVSLNSAKTGEIIASSPEELLETATGWIAPISNLASWVQARASKADAEVSYDASKRLMHLAEDGWDVDFSYNDNAALPNKLVMLQNSAQHGEIRITMTIQNR